MLDTAAGIPILLRIIVFIASPKFTGPLVFSHSFMKNTPEAWFHIPDPADLSENS